MMKKGVLFVNCRIPYELSEDEYGVKTYNAQDEHECFDLLDTSTGIKVVVFDIDSAGMSCKEFLRELKKRYYNIEVIFAGEKKNLDLILEILDHGAFDYILKPYDFDDIFPVIYRAFICLEQLRNSRIIEKKLQQREIMYRTLVENSNDGIAIVADGKFKYVNPSLLRQLGYMLEDIVDTNVNLYFHEDNPVHIRLNFKFDEAGKNEIVLLAKDKSPVYMEYNSSFVDFEGVEAFLVMLRDITERKQFEEQITYISFHDKTTGLYNRAFFEQELKRLDTHRQLPITVIIGDVDGLKLTNDAFGHIAGDNLLKEAADIIKTSCRHEDIVARWGGDEFVILLPNTDKDVAEKIINRITVSLEKTNYENEHLSISFGWDTKYSDKENIMETFTKAENNMYRKKLIDSPNYRTCVIKNIINTLFKKNKREERHAKRVSFLSHLIANEMKLDEKALEDIKTIGLVHDVGKIVLIDYILDKKETLTYEERKEIYRHPEVGYRILNSSSDMSEFAHCVLAHHERYDGKGYPKGLKGREIPLEARIVAVADAFAAMTEERPYGKALSLEEAEEEIERCSGLQFDPDIAEIMISIIHSDPEKTMYHI